MPVDVDQSLREQWRELGFFYEFNKARACWQFVGSRSGLLKFCDLLNEYASQSRNENLGEHYHYGPYWYLKVTTWREAFISEDGIFGTLSDLKRLASLVDVKLRASFAGDTLSISSEYSESSQTGLKFTVKEEGFDPASEDRQVSTQNLSGNTDN